MSAWSALCITLFSNHLLFLLSCVIHLTSSSRFRHHGSDVQLGGKFRTLDLLSRERDTHTKMCPPDHYADKTERRCRPCSVCPMNHIIRRPCSAGEDTRCGPFVEFERFRQKPGTQQAPHVAKLLPRLEQPRKHYRQRENHQNKGKEEVMTSTVTSLSVVTASECQPWRVLSMVLVMVLGCVCCCLVVCILYTCRLHHSLQSQVPGEPDPSLPYHSGDPEPPRYVDPFLLQRHCPPTSRHFPLYQNIGTGSDVTVPLTSCDVHNMARPDSAGEKRDHHQYVYLKGPSSSAGFV